MSTNTLLAKLNALNGAIHRLIYFPDTLEIWAKHLKFFKNQEFT